MPPPPPLRINNRAAKKEPDLDHDAATKPPLCASLSPIITPMMLDLEDGILPEPKQYEEYEAYSGIMVWTGDDENYKRRNVICDEFESHTLKQRYSRGTFCKPEQANERVYIVYIAEFFTDDTDMVYFVQGISDISQLMYGASGIVAYRGKAYCSPCLGINYLDLFRRKDKNKEYVIVAERIRKTDTRGLRHRYLFESAVAAWNEVEFDDEKWDLMMNDGTDRDKSSSETVFSEENQATGKGNIMPGPEDSQKETKPYEGKYDLAGDTDVDKES